MKSIEISKKKLCNFYANEWHLSIMILPYVNEKVEEGYSVITFMESGITNYIYDLLGKLNLPNEKKIQDINWGTIISQDMKNKMLNLENNTIIIVKGSKEYIQTVNEYINHHTTKINIEVINCYEIMDFSKDMQLILDCHDKVLNTSGEKEISEVFEGYHKEYKEKKIDL